VITFSRLVVSRLDFHGQQSTASIVGWRHRQQLSVGSSDRPMWRNWQAHFIVDLFPSKKALPTDLMEVMLRRDRLSIQSNSPYKYRDVVNDFPSWSKKCLAL
jgi:hypothetical protein